MYHVSVRKLSRHQTRCEMDLPLVAECIRHLILGCYQCTVLPYLLMGIYCSACVCININGRAKQLHRRSCKRKEHTGILCTLSVSVSVLHLSTCNILQGVLRSQSGLITCQVKLKIATKRSVLFCSY